MDRNVSSINSASTTCGSLWIEKLPNMIFDVVKFTLPSVSLQKIENQRPTGSFSLQGTIMEFGEFSVIVRVSDNWSNYIELFEYMSNTSTTRIDTDENTINDKCTVNLTLTDSLKKPVKSIHLIEAFPTYISSIDFSTEESNINLEIKFDYSGFKFIR